MKYRLYMLYCGEWGDVEILSKGRCDVRGHWIYYLQGEHDGHRVSGNVSRDVWERFDVPVTESKARRRMRHSDYARDLNAETYRRGRERKCEKRVFNREIEAWLSERYGISESDLDGECDD